MLDSSPTTLADQGALFGGASSALADRSQNGTQGAGVAEGAQGNDNAVADVLNESSAQHAGMRDDVGEAA